MTQGLFEFRNSGNENLSWPEKYEMEGVVSPETSRECNITNHGEAPVLNISLKFNSIFKEEKTGKAVFSKTDQFVINAIAPGATFTFHVVNQSPFLVEANYPQEATLRIRGESMERIVPLTYSNTVLDLAGQQPFAPSYIHWRGVPKQAQSTKTVAPIVIPNSSNARPTFVPKATFSPIEGENNDAAAKRRLATRQGLTQLMEEAEQLLRKCEDMSKPAPQAQVDDWKRRAEKFLETNLDRSFVLRFRIALPYSSGTSGLDEAHGNLWREVYSRWMHLAEFLNKLD